MESPSKKYPAVLVSRATYTMLPELSGTDPTDEVHKTLLELPDGLDPVPDLPETRDEDGSFPGVLSRTMFLEEKPGQGNHEPDCGAKGDDHAESPVVVGFARRDLQAEHNSDDDCQDDDLDEGLDDVGDVGQSAARQAIGVVVLVAGDGPGDVRVGLVLHFGRVARQTREGGVPEREGQLVGDQPDNVQPDGRAPFALIVDAQPAETDPVGDDWLYNQEPRSPGTKVGEAADEEEKNGLDGERDAVAEEHNTVDCVGLSGEAQQALVAGGLAQQVLKGRGSKVCGPNRGELLSHYFLSDRLEGIPDVLNSVRPFTPT